MHHIGEILQNSCLWTAVCAWFIAQGLKVLQDRKFTWRRFLSSGGMPSSHTASVVAISVMVGGKMGFDTALFAACCVFGIVVMYDAAGVRRETGRQGKAINDIVQKVLVENEPITDDIMKEVMGHRPVEVAMGALLGIAVAVVSLLLGF